MANDLPLVPLSNHVSGILGTANGGTGQSSVDDMPTEDSVKMVKSGGVYTALAGKSDTGHTHDYSDLTNTPDPHVLEVYVIESNTDLNTLLDEGWYVCPLNSVAATLSNCPINKAFWMEVHSTGNNAWYQHIVEFTVATGKQYFRKKYSAFGNWTQMSVTVTDDVTDGVLSLVIG